MFIVSSNKRIFYGRKNILETMRKWILSFMQARVNRQNRDFRVSQFMFFTRFTDTEWKKHFSLFQLLISVAFHYCVVRFFATFTIFFHMHRDVRCWTIERIMVSLWFTEFLFFTTKTYKIYIVNKSFLSTSTTTSALVWFELAMMLISQIQPRTFKRLHLTKTWQQ